MAELLFYVLSVLAVIGAIGVVAAKSPMMSVISLLGSFFALALIYLLAGFQFMAAIQVMVYVGAIMVLFLYVIMLLNLSDIGQAAEHNFQFVRGPWAWLGGALAGALCLVGLFATQRSRADMHAFEHPVETGEASALAEAGNIDAVSNLAGELFSRYFLPFEAVGILLLATMVAVIVLAKRERQSPSSGGSH